jgi:hypothetical protein
MSEREWCGGGRGKMGICCILNLKKSIRDCSLKFASFEELKGLIFTNPHHT